MAKMRVTLGIGFVGANHEAMIEVDDVELSECETEEEREELLAEYWQDWANNYIEGNFHLEE